MTEASWERYPLIAQEQYARSWLTIQAHLGPAPATVNAFGHALQDFLAFSARRGVPPTWATREHILSTLTTYRRVL